MKISLSNDAPLSVAVDWLVVPVSGKKPLQDPLLQKLDRALGGALAAHVKEESFEAKRGKTLTMALPGKGRVRPKQLLIVGLGEGTGSQAMMRLLGVKAGRIAMSQTSLAVVAPTTDPALLGALADGIGTGAYRYTRYLTGSRVPKRQLTKASILLERKPSSEQKHSVHEGSVTATAVNFARDLVNCPPNDLTATVLADEAKKRSDALGLDCKV
ncbi:MAG TPA: M17 family peptidase N-terminal domain-containing protein, partial [Polyangiales bacterium]|nr:M17 family peptidase N-terminal domain-containing protein [Polyangiales bacterium]